jgi:hypothetical protein
VVKGRRFRALAAALFAAIFAAIFATVAVGAAGAQTAASSPRAARDSAAETAASRAEMPRASEEPVSLLLQISGPKTLDIWRYGDTLAAVLMRSRLILSVHRAYNADPARLDNLARYEGAPVVLALELSEEGGRVSARWRLSAAARGATSDAESGAKDATIAGMQPVEGSFTKPVPSEDELASSFWVETVDAVNGFLSGLRTAHLRITGAPGTVVQGFGDPILLPDSGSAILPVILPERIPWTASTPERYPESGVFYASKDGETLTLPRRQWALDFGAYGFAFPELRVSFAPGSRFFTRATISQFAFGMSLQSPNNGVEAPLTLSFPLFQAGFGFGSYFEPQIRELRTYLAMDFFARLFSPQGRGIYLDPVAPIGIQPAVGLEWGRGPVARLYVEMSAVFYPWAMPGLMAASLDGNSASSLIFGGSGWFPGQSGWFLEIPLFRIGMRFRL